MKQLELIPSQSRIAPNRYGDEESAETAGETDDAGNNAHIVRKIVANRDYFESEIRKLLTPCDVEYIGEISDSEKPSFLSGAIAAYAIAGYIGFCAVLSLIATALMTDYTGKDIHGEYED